MFNIGTAQSKSGVIFTVAVSYVKWDVYKAIPWYVSGDMMLLNVLLDEKTCPTTYGHL